MCARSGVARAAARSQPARSHARDMSATSFWARHYVALRITATDRQSHHWHSLDGASDAARSPFDESDPEQIRRVVRSTLGTGCARRRRASSRPVRSRVELSGIPALNFDSDEGFGYGVVLAAYDYRPQAASYAWTIEPTVFLTTRGRRDYTIFFDAPAGATHPFRYTAFAGREEQLAAPYYGIGNSTPYDPSVESEARATSIDTDAIACAPPSTRSIRLAGPSCARCSAAAPPTTAST